VAYLPWLGVGDPLHITWLVDYRLILCHMLRPTLVVQRKSTIGREHRKQISELERSSLSQSPFLPPPIRLSATAPYEGSRVLLEEVLPRLNLAQASPTLGHSPAPCLLQMLPSEAVASFQLVKKEAHPLRTPSHQPIGALLLRYGKSLLRFGTGLRPASPRSPA
jgi:hypothetical protein